MRSVTTRGTEQTAAKLFSDQPCIERYSRSVVAGDDEWVNLAVALLPSLDEGLSELTEQSLAAALQNNPAPILRFLERRHPDAFVCSLTGADATVSAADVITEFVNRKRSVETVRDASLQGIKNTCIQRIDEQISSYKRS